MSELNDKAVGILAEIFIWGYLHAVPKVVEGFSLLPGIKEDSLADLSRVRCIELVSHVANINQHRLIESAIDIAGGCRDSWHQDGKALERVIGRFNATTDGLLTEWRKSLHSILEKRWATLDDMGKRMLISSPLYPERDKSVYGFLY